MKLNFSKYWREFKEIIKKREMSILPAHLAYYFLVSTIPALALIFFVASSFNLNFDILSNFMLSIFSDNMVNTITNIVKNASLNLSNVFLLLVAFYVASNGAKSIIVASNTVFNIPTKGIIKRRIKAFIITIILIVLLTFILIVPLFGNSILKFFALLKIDTEITYILNMIFPILKWPLTLFVLYIFIKILYTIAPDEKIPSSSTTKGSIFTTISWTIITAVYSFYINNIAAYDKMYGALSVIVILMLWFWLLSFVFVIGLALNYTKVEEEIEKTNTIKLQEIKEKMNKKNNKN